MKCSKVSFLGVSSLRQLIIHLTLKGFEVLIYVALEYTGNRRLFIYLSRMLSHSVI